ncbi:Neuropeptides capa receptor [Holothuria leucospilota]|uniref:Neuropeptides capa receptor n=1 Tax=Holothuria leucospilota TaxID=206669 RepID=A0A9Q1H8J2_HOLLE|nr:Neuropeptides capa receptor [Holothuria leucospilota]
MSSHSGEPNSFLEDKNNEYSISYYDYFTTEECTGFGWDLSNHTQDDLQPCTVNSTEFLVLTLIIQPIVAVLGILGNVAFMFIVWKEPHMRNNMNLILLNLAVADLLYLLVGVGEKFVNSVTSPVSGDCTVFGRVGQCFIINPLISVASFTSLFLVSFFSFERYVAICTPMKHLLINGRKRTFYHIGLVWFSSFALTAIILPTYSDFSTVCIKWPNETLYSNYPTQAAFCETQTDIWIPVGEMVEIFAFFIALLLNVVCFVKITSKLYGRKQFSFGGTPVYEDDPVRAQHRNSAHAATRMLLINGIAFFVLATPFHLTSAIEFAEHIFSDWIFPCTFYKDLSVTLLYVNSAVNPYIYGVTNQFYRQAYRNMLCQKLPNRNPNNADVT